MTTKRRAARAAVKPATRKPKPKARPKTMASGTAVSWHYRSAIGHGRIASVAKIGTTSANTLYNIHEVDHHPGEKPIVQHYGSALTRAAIPKAKKATKK